MTGGTWTQMQAKVMTLIEQNAKDIERLDADMRAVRNLFTERLQDIQEKTDQRFANSDQRVTNLAIKLAWILGGIGAVGWSIATALAVLRFLV